MLAEIVIITINIVLSLLYKSKIELNEKEKKIINNLIIAIQILLFLINIYLLPALIFLLLYEFIYKKKILLIFNIITNCLFYLINLNPLILILLLIYNPLILWSKL